jgi:hypothetical protein
LPVAQVAESGVSTEAQVGRRWLRERLDLRQRRGTVSPLPTVQSMGYPHGTQVTVRVPESAVTVVWVVPDEET